tara:strand:- start:70 stop:633 length:564 start_codon:yes stop_codon:yes gene_type:complete
MKYLVLLLFTFNVNASFFDDVEYAVEYSRHQTQMEWKGASAAKFRFSLNQLGVVVFKNDFGVRLVYGQGNATKPNLDGKHQDLFIHLKSAVDLEFLYRYKLYDKTFAYAGVGYYWQHVPISNFDDTFYKDDRDNDIGYTLGLDHKMNEHLSAQFVFHHYSRISASKNDRGAMGSTHNALGISFRYTF